MMSLATFRQKIQTYLRLSGDSQKALASEVGLFPTVLSRKLHGGENKTLTFREIKAIILALVRWGAINQQSEVYELLADMNCQDFSPEEWKTPPLNQLKVAQAVTASPAKPTAPVSGAAVPAPKPGAVAGQTQKAGLTGPAQFFGLETPMVGREAQLNELERCYGQALTGQPQVVLIVGEAGIGKTRLALEACHLAQDRGAACLLGRAFETGGSLPYQPVIEALRRYFENHAKYQFHRLLEPIWLAELTRLLPELTGNDQSTPAFRSLSQNDEAEARTRLFESIARLVTILATTPVSKTLNGHSRIDRENPPPGLVFLVDDLQWADKTSLDVLHYAIRRWQELHSPVMLILTARSEALTRNPVLGNWLASISRENLLTRLELKELTAEDTTSLVESLSGKRSIFGRWLFAETGGLPFFIIEMLKALLERGLIHFRLDETGRQRLYFEISSLEPNQGLARSLIPPGVEELVRSRLEKLSEPAYSMLVAAAVLGQKFDFELLCQVAGLTEIEGLGAFDELMASLLVRQVLNQGGLEHGIAAYYIISHDKIREAVYSRAGEARRRIFHRRAFQALQQTLVEKHVPAASLAHHALGSGQFEEAFRYNSLAGDEAQAIFASAEARFHYKEALDCLARLADTPETRAYRLDNLIKKVSVSYSVDPPKHSLALLREAEALLEEFSGPSQAPVTTDIKRKRAYICSLNARAYYYMNDRQEALENSHITVELARELHDVELEATASSLIGRVLFHQGLWKQARPYLEQPLPLLERAANYPELILTKGYLGDVLAGTGDYRAGVKLCQEALGLAQARHIPIARTFCHLYLALAYFQGEDVEKAYQQSQELLTVGKWDGESLAIYIGYGMNAIAQCRIGRPEEALENFRLQQEFAESLGGGRLNISDWFASGRAENALALKDYAGALRLAGLALEESEAISGYIAGGAAQRVAAEALAYLNPSDWGQVEARFEAALALFEKGSLLLELARTQRTWGLVCQQHQKQAEGQKHLDLAAKFYRAGGMEEESSQWSVASSQ